VEKAYSLCEEIRGHQHPYTLEVYECNECPNALCQIAGAKSREMKV
jgi:hypothetical protein